MTTSEPWKIDRTINIPSLFSILSVAVTGIWWIATLQAQVNANTKEINDWKITWAQFTQAREITVRNYEQRMTTQENLGREIMRRLDEIRNEQIRLQQMRENRLENPR